MKRIALVVGLHLIALGAVVAVVSGVARPQTPMASEPSPPLTAPAPQIPPPAQSPPFIAPPTPIQSRCEAADLAYLVGKPRTEIPVPVDPTSRRVSCTACPVTQDYRPERTDILFDAQTGLITEVKCG
jgi:hypothetical protein